MDDELVERVLTAVEQIPPGRVVSYGDIGEIVGTGPRQIGAVMSHYGSAVAWWRVTNANGEFPATLRSRVRDHWADEGIRWKPNGKGCRIADYRHDLDDLRTDYEAAIATVIPDHSP